MEAQRPVAAGKVVRWDDVLVDETNRAVRVRREMEQMCAAQPDMIMTEGWPLPADTRLESATGICRALGTLIPVKTLSRRERERSRRLRLTMTTQAEVDVPGAANRARF